MTTPPIRIVERVPWGDYAGAGCTLKQYNQAIAQDPACRESVSSGGRILLNEALLLGRTNPRELMEHCLAPTEKLFKGHPEVELAIRPVFLNDKKYEILVAAVRKRDGSVHFIFTDSMMGKNGGVDHVINLGAAVGELKEGAAIGFDQNENKINLRLGERPVAACAVALAGMVYNLMDAVASGKLNEITPDSVRSYFRPETLEIGPIVERMNQAVASANAVEGPQSRIAPSNNAAGPGK